MALLELEKEKFIAGRPSLMTRPRRLRATPALRAMIRETELKQRDFIYPLFVRHGQGRSEIRSMPGVYQRSHWVGKLRGRWNCATGDSCHQKRDSRNGGSDRCMSV